MQVLQPLGREVLIIFFTTDRLQHFIELVLHGLQLPFFFDESQLLLFQFSFTGADRCFQAVFFISLGIALFIQFLVGKIEPFEGSFGKFNTDFSIVLFDLVIFLCFFGLAFQGFELIVDFKQEIFDTRQVRLCGFQFLFCFLFPRLVNGNTCSLFQHFAAAVVFVLDQVIHHVEGDDCITIGADTGIHKQVLDIFQAALYIIQAVFTFSAFVEFAGNGNSSEFGR